MLFESFQCFYMNCKSKLWLLYIFIYFMKYRFLSVMKELSNISRISSGVGLITPRVLSLSFSLTPILISRILF